MMSGRKEEVASSKGRVVTLEALIIDTFTRVDDEGEETPIDRPDEIGGAGTYAIIGARMFVPSSAVGMIADYEATSFPEQMDERLQEYGPGMLDWREREDGHPTTKAVNRYKGQLRQFEYLTEPILHTPSSLLQSKLRTPPPKILHFVSYLKRTLAILAEVEELKELGWVPKLFWEPEPPTCYPEYLDMILVLGSQMDVLSPNHTEALRMLSIPEPDVISAETYKPLVEQAALSIARCRPRIATIIRAGWLGCCYVPTVETWKDPEAFWIPPYWDEGPMVKDAYAPRETDEGASSHSNLKGPDSLTGGEAMGAPKEEMVVKSESSVAVEDRKPRLNKAEGKAKVKVEAKSPKPDDGSVGSGPSKVVDPTGAGNAFMGGLAAAISLDHDIEEACIWASVSASFTIEQHGLPNLEVVGGRELWNGEDPQERVDKLRKRLAWESAM